MPVWSSEEPEVAKQHTRKPILLQTRENQSWPLCSLTSFTEHTLVADGSSRRFTRPTCPGLRNSSESVMAVLRAALQASTLVAGAPLICRSSSPSIKPRCGRFSLINMTTGSESALSAFFSVDATAVASSLTPEVLSVLDRSLVALAPAPLAGGPVEALLMLTHGPCATETVSSVGSAAVRSDCGVAAITKPKGCIREILRICIANDPHASRGIGPVVKSWSRSGKDRALHLGSGGLKQGSQHTGKSRGSGHILHQGVRGCLSGSASSGNSL
mmetsp:Transcript_16875/g.48188  ORF Transcript_16875/g.48188 Transcript_16875/m.48188 type:complete len:272 (-) Transcript_16875:471-1286(-)